jgi:hypothetical protein
MYEPQAFGKIQVLLLAITLAGAGCSHRQARQLIAGGPAPGSGPEFMAESEQPMPDNPPIPTRSAIGQLRAKGLDVALVVPRSGRSLATLNDMKAKLPQLVESIHRLVPIARVGIVVYDVEPDKIATVPMTNSLPVLVKSLAGIRAQRSQSANEDVSGALRAAVSTMNWNPDAKRVIILVADTTIRPKDATDMVGIARKFHAAGGWVNTLDATPYSEFNSQSYKSTHEELRSIAAAGGGTVKLLTWRKPVPKHRIAPLWDRA